MSISFSAHISNKKSAITGVSKLKGVANHNLRMFVSEHPRSYCIRLIEGTDFLYRDVTDLYHKLFDEAQEEYNKRQTRDDRKITDYFDSICKKKNQDVAVEMIIQVGDKEFWDGIKRTDKEYENKIEVVYKEVLNKIQEELPDYKVANAVIHFDEASPHMHIVGVPVRENCKTGLKVQVSKRTVFTQDSLSNELQGKVREYAEGLVEKAFGVSFNEKKKGKNHDLTVTEYKVAKEREKLAQTYVAIVKGNQQLAEIQERAALAERQANLADKKAREINTKFEESKREYENFEDIVRRRIPEPEGLMSARKYKEKYVEPFAEWVITTFKKAMNAFINLYIHFRDLKEANDALSRCNERLQDNIKEICSDRDAYKERSDTLYAIEDLLGDEAFKGLIDKVEKREQAEYEREHIKTR